MKRVILCTLAVLAAGCSDADRAASPTAPANRSAVPAAAPDGAAHQVARALALAMTEPEARAAVRDAMRASRVTEHKLVLQEFVGTPRGRLLLRAAARKSGTSEAALQRTIGQLPPLDFYAPFVQHRRSWKATPDVAVGAVVDPRSQVLTAFRADGSQVSLAARDGTPGIPVLVLHGAELKLPRPGAEPDGGGDVIQAMDEHSPEGGGGAPEDNEQFESGGVSPAPTMYFESMFSRVQDCWGCGDAEIRVLFEDANGNELGRKEFTDVPAESVIYPGAVVPRAAQIHLREIDSWAPDDDKGSQSVIVNPTVMTPGARSDATVEMSFCADVYEWEILWNCTFHGGQHKSIVHWSAVFRG